MLLSTTALAQSGTGPKACSISQMPLSSRSTDRSDPYSLDFSQPSPYGVYHQQRLETLASYVSLDQSMTPRFYPGRGTSTPTTNASSLIHSGSVCPMYQTAMAAP